MSVLEYNKNGRVVHVIRNRIVSYLRLTKWWLNHFRVANRVLPRERQTLKYISVTVFVWWRIRRPSRVTEVSSEVRTLSEKGSCNKK